MIAESKYSERFKSADLSALKLVGSILMVEVAEMQEVKTASGLILAQGKDKQINSVEANLPTFVHVLAVGEGHYDETTGETVKLDTKPGDILLVGRNSVVRFGAMGFTGYQPFDIGVVNESETQARFDGIEGLKRFIRSLDKQT